MRTAALGPSRSQKAKKSKKKGGEEEDVIVLDGADDDDDVPLAVKKRKRGGDGEAKAGQGDASAGAGAGGAEGKRLKGADGAARPPPDPRFEKQARALWELVDGMADAKRARAGPGPSSVPTRRPLRIAHAPPGASARRRAPACVSLLKGA